MPMMILLFVKSDSIQHSKSKIMNDHNSVTGGASDTGKSGNPHHSESKLQTVNTVRRTASNNTSGCLVSVRFLNGSTI